jgi:hypothetical protein
MCILTIFFAAYMSSVSKTVIEGLTTKQPTVSQPIQKPPIVVPIKQLNVSNQPPQPIQLESVQFSQGVGENSTEDLGEFVQQPQTSRVVAKPPQQPQRLQQPLQPQRLQQPPQPPPQQTKDVSFGGFFTVNGVKTGLQCNCRPLP